MKRIARIVLALLCALALTPLVFLALTRIDAIPAWLYSERGYAALDPLFDLFGAVGVEGHEGVIVGVLLVLSFAISGAIVAAGAALLRRRCRPTRC
ncbi:MAG: hypothetical protein LBV73_19960 [Paraburkholderia sp.]|jgi:hypothetical protein|nr:hypothetical protein [Paraburkholderia sp.]